MCDTFSFGAATSATYSVVIKVIGKNLNNVVYGGYDGIRTCDPIIMSDVL